MRRQDGSVNFNRNWAEYKFGFGDPSGEFFIGLERLHELTSYGPPQELLLTLRDFKDEFKYARYDSFRVGNETEKYALLDVGAYSGDAGDILIKHKGLQFSTPDQYNGPDNRNWAEAYGTGWWFAYCYYWCGLL